MDESIVIEMRKNGSSYGDIAAAVGETRDRVRNLCRKAGLGGRISQKDTRNSNKDVAARIAASGNNVSYISGYTNNCGIVRVSCDVCGFVFERSYNAVAFSKVRCPSCAERRRVERENIRAEESRIKKKERTDKKLLKTVKKPVFEKQCVVCGRLFVTARSNSVCCSNECSRKRRNRNSDARLTKNNCDDWNITLEALFKRDKGVCHICGGSCDYEDYIIRDGTFIAGDWYPSVDHVTPLAKGGRHNWDNVKLAHRFCNAVKSDKL